MVFGEETDAVECDMKALVHSERVCVCVCESLLCQWMGSVGVWTDVD